MAPRKVCGAVSMTAIAASTLLSACGIGDAGAPPAPVVVAGATAHAPSPVSIPEAEPVHLRVPSVGVDAEIDPVQAGPEGIDPPTMDDAGWWTARGMPGSSDTVYIAGHAVDTGEGAFTALQSVVPGAEIEVDTAAGAAEYRIDSIVLYDKDTLESVDEVWAAVPGRLLLVTCYLADGDTTTDQNYVVYASLVG